jgi:hypothetical protein
VTRARALAALALLALGGAAGCGGGDDREPAGALRWEKEPVLVKPARLPNDRIVFGMLVNDGRDRADLVAKDLKLLTTDGKRVPASAAFVESFLHGLYPPTRLPGGRLPISEQLRMGIIARVLPGKTVPLTISWRQPAGSEPPVRIEWAKGSIPVPDKAPEVAR